MSADLPAEQNPYASPAISETLKVTSKNSLAKQSLFTIKARNTP
ncbi:MAG: hypothetical protein ACKVH8_22920 [Pirellulales bacterium]